MPPMMAWRKAGTDRLNALRPICRQQNSTGLERETHDANDQTDDNAVSLVR
jgi:hypothetical protein